MTLEDIARARITQWRKTAGMTQKQLGARCGRNAVWVNRWENGRFNTDFDTVARMAAAFDQTLYAALDVNTDPAEQLLLESYRALPTAGRVTMLSVMELLGRTAAAAAGGRGGAASPARGTRAPGRAPRGATRATPRK